MDIASSKVLARSIELLEAIERSQPSLYRAVYPRIYREPKRSQYYSPRQVAASLAQIALKVQSGSWGSNEKFEFLFASTCAEFRVPTYFIGYGLMEALGETRIPGPIDWKDMELPFPAASFLPPKGTVLHPTEGDVVFLGYVRLPKGLVKTSLLDRNFDYGSSDGGMVILAVTASGFMYHWNITEETHGPAIHLAALNGTIEESNAHISHWPMPDIKMSDADNQFMIRVAHFVFAILLVMTARPTLVEVGQQEKRVRNKRNEIREFWSPTVIGENYRVRYRTTGQTGEASHVHPRLHFVPGFARQQPYGPKRSLRKTVWIEPFLRGGKDDAE